jgi:hypothetical protein
MDHTSISSPAPTVQFSPQLSSSTTNPPSENKISSICDVVMRDYKANIHSWHSRDHGDARNLIFGKICDIIRSRRLMPTQDWIDKLQVLSTYLEKRLYYASNSLEE